MMTVPKRHGWPHQALGPFNVDSAVGSPLTARVRFRGSLSLSLKNQSMHTVQNALVTIISFLFKSDHVISIQISNQICPIAKDINTLIIM